MAANPARLQRAEALAGRILKMCVEMGGSITGEHGIGVEKREYPARHVQCRGDRLHARDCARHSIRWASPIPARCFPKPQLRRSRNTACIRWKRLE